MSSIYYQCQRCTACCRIPGFVKVSPQEIDAAAQHLQMSSDQFIDQYCELLPSRAGLTLKSQPDHACIFLEGDACRIHEAKPEQCRGFPNTWNFPGWRKMCHAIPVERKD